MASTKHSTNRITALVPVKARALCKTRLAESLSAEQRLALARKMLDAVIKVLDQSPAIDRLVILSPERDTLAGDIEIIEDEGWDLNSSLEIAIKKIRDKHAGKILIIPADLPYLEENDIAALSDAATDNNTVIAPDTNDSGTNALLLSTDQPFKLKFGPNSFAAHRNFCNEHGYSCSVIKTPGLATDIDTINDLRQQDKDSLIDNYTIPRASA